MSEHGPPHRLSSSALLNASLHCLVPLCSDAFFNMEASGQSSSQTRGSAVSGHDGHGMGHQPNHDDPDNYVTIHDSRSSYNNPCSLPPPHEHSSSSSYNDYNDKQNSTTTIATAADCDRRRPEEGGHPRMVNMSSSLISQTVTPFLREHIPNNYAPISKGVDNEHEYSHSHSKDPNSKFCYRHRPDSKCRKAADESKMGMIQRVCLQAPCSLSSY